MADQYWGITGFTHPNQPVTVLQNLPADLQPKIMIGVLASWKTLTGLAPGQPKRYPPIEATGAIFPDDLRVLNLYHYNTPQPKTLAQQLFSLVNYGGPYLHGFQLNMTWPPVGQLQEFRARYPDIKIVLRINNESLYLVDHNLEKLAKKIRLRYQRYIDYVLIDMSGGTGRLLDVNHTYILLNSLRLWLNPRIGLAVAGGLNANNLNILRPVVHCFRNLSIDTESGVRDAENNLSTTRCLDYLGQAHEIFA
jgi:hypothetical protein